MTAESPFSNSENDRLAYPDPNGSQIFGSEVQPTEKLGPKFEIDKPVNSNMIKITGNGPKETPIILVDVSEFGAELAETLIGSDGLFV